MLALFKDGMEFLEDGVDKIEGKEKEPEPEIPKLQKTTSNTIIADWVFSLNIIRNLERKGLKEHKEEEASRKT